MSASKSSLGLAAAATSVVMPPLPEVPSAPEPTLVASGAPQPPMLPTPPPVIAVAHEAASAVDANGPLQGLLARLKRDAWLWGGALAGGIVLGAGVWWFASSHGEVPQSTNPPAAVANNAAPDAQATETDAIEDTVVAEDALTTLPNAADAEATAVANGADAQAAASDATHEEPAASNATGASATDDRQQTKPASESDPKLASDTDNASPTAAATEATAQEGDHTATPAIKLEPLASKPTTDDAAANASATDGSDSSVGKTAEAAGADDAKPAAEPRKPGARPATNSPVTRRTVSQTEVDQRLTNALPRVSFQKVPLQRFVEFLNDLTNLPITIDEPALRKAGLDRQAPVSVQATGQTTGEILRAALAPLHLECSLVDGQLVITTGSPAETE